MKRYVILAGLLAALILFTTAYVLHIPIGTSGGYIHLGDTMVYLAAALLPAPYAVAAAAVGGCLADVVSGAAAWALPTALIKAAMVLPFTGKKPTILCKRNLLAPVVSGVIGIGGYFVAECVLMRLAGTDWVVAAAGAVAAILPNGMQELAGGVAFLVLGAALDRLQVKKRLVQTFGG